jgi:hypothetical protein
MLFSNAEFTFLNGSSTNNGTGNWSNGNVIAAEFDFINNLAYVNRNGGGWSSGFDISIMTGSPFYFCAELYQSGNYGTVNFGATSFSITPQSGFVAWDTGVSVGSPFISRVIGPLAGF